jgi:hypothetical protein
MTDRTTGDDAHPPVARNPFSASRLLYSLLFAVIAWFAFWVILLLAAVQLIFILANSRVSEDLRRTSLNAIQYLWELLAYISCVRDEQPFPVGPFPSYASPAGKA